MTAARDIFQFRNQKPISTMTSVMNTARATSAWLRICSPHEAPIAVYVTSPGCTLASSAIPARTEIVSSSVRGRVWMRTAFSPREKTWASKSLASKPATLDLTSSMVLSVTGIDTWKSVPPRNSVPSDSPLRPTAMQQMARMTAEKEYQNFL